MIYLVKYTDGNYRLYITPLKPNLLTDKFELIEKVCDKRILTDINKYLREKLKTTINSSIELYHNGYELVRYEGLGVQLYVVDSEHKDFKNLIRDCLINNILC